MGTFLQALKDLVDPQILQDGPLVLHEDQAGSTCPPIKLEQAGRQAVALRFEPRRLRGGPELPINEWLFPLFDASRSTPPVCRSCDYIVFYAPRNDAKEVFVFLCELKSGSTRGAATQLRNGFLLARYLVEVIELHGEVHPWPLVQFRGIVFSGDAPTRRGSLRPLGHADYLADDQTDLRITTARARGGHHLQTFCA